MTYEETFTTWKDVKKTVMGIGAIALCVVLLLDDVTGIGTLDDPAAVGIGAYGISVLERVASGFMSMFNGGLHIAHSDELYK